MLGHIINAVNLLLEWTESTQTCKDFQCQARRYGCLALGLKMQKLFPRPAKYEAFDQFSIFNILICLQQLDKKCIFRTNARCNWSVCMKKKMIMGEVEDILEKKFKISKPALGKWIEEYVVSLI